MALKKLEQYGGFDAINGDVHRQPASLVAHPAFARHLGFAEVQSRTEEIRASAVKTFIDQLGAQLVKQGAEYDKDTFSAPIHEEGRGRVARLHFIWKGIAVSIRIEIHTENIALTCFLDLSLDRRGRGGLPQLCQYTYEGLRGLSRLDDYSPAQVRKLRRRVYDFIWQELFSNVIDADGMLSDNFGEVFCDFRGLIVGDQSGNLTTPDPNFTQIRPPFCEESHLRGQRLDYSSRSPSWADEIVKRVWPLLCDPDSDAELTVSRFLDGRAVYISALGDPYHQSRGAKWDPINYYMHFANGDAFQIGRLIDRIHFLGMMRLAALFQINEIQALGIKLNQIEHSIAALTPRISKEVREAEIRTREETINDASIGSDMSLIEDIGKIVDQGTAVLQSKNGSLTSRVEKSMYYIERFKADIPALRIRRLEGYQPYDEFVFRRLGGSFLFIEMISSRLLQHSSNMRILSDYVTAVSVARSLQETRKLEQLNLNAAMLIVDNAQETRRLTQSNVEVATNNLNLAHKMSELNMEIDDIQDIGEIVLFLVIAPHYFAETISGIIKESAPKGMQGLLEPFLLFAGVIIGVGIVKARIRLSVARKYDEKVGEANHLAAASGSSFMHSSFKVFQFPFKIAKLGLQVKNLVKTTENFLEWHYNRKASLQSWRRSADTKWSELQAYKLKIMFANFILMLAVLSFGWALSSAILPASRDLTHVEQPHQRALNLSAPQRKSLQVLPKGKQMLGQGQSQHTQLRRKVLKTFSTSRQNASLRTSK